MTTEYLINREMRHVLAALTWSNQLVARVCLHTGLRLGDVLALKTEQLRPRFWVTESKTKKRRQIGLPGPLLQDLFASAGNIWVFPGRLDPTKHRTRQAVWKDIKRAAKAFRLSQNVAPHSLRKFYAVELLGKYGDIARVQRNLNHDRQTTTLLYAMSDKLLQSKKTAKR